VAEQRVQRRLAAILAADVVGYSRLIREDEAGTLAQLKVLRKEVFDSRTAEHNGRIVKTTGDGVLVEFASAVDATECAVKIQQALARRNEDVPEGQRIELRIGINLGDIVVDGQDIFGDGVNVAARLEGLCDTGEVFVSAVVHDQVEGKFEATFEDLGEHTVKNIDKPIRVYRVSPEVGPSAFTAANPDQSLPLPDKPSIAVLPFENMSGDPEQVYFSDGITEDLITSLSKLSQLMVIARNSSFTYKGRAVMVQQVGEELGVSYVLEGSVRKSANRVRITAQLVECATGGHLWAERYDRDLTDIFAVQDEVTAEIVTAMAVTLTPDEQQRLVRKGTDNLEAYDYLLRAREKWWQLSREGTTDAEAMLELAIALDPDFSTPYAWLSYVRLQEHIHGWRDESEQPLEQASDLAKKAIALDDADTDAHNALGCAYLWQKQHDLAIAEYERAITLDPHNARAHFEIGWVLHYAGRSAEAVEPITWGMRLDPQYSDVYLHILAQVYFRLGRFEEAISLLHRRIIRNPDTAVSRVLLAASYGHLGRIDEAKAQWADALAVNPEFSLEQRRQVLPYKNPADFEHIVEGLHKAGLPAC
jgi:adenylate cyclase